jgi:nitroreductase
MRDGSRFAQFCGQNSLLSDKVSFQALLNKQTHVIEKGLSMPESRVGFGADKIDQLKTILPLYVSQFGWDEISRMCHETLSGYCSFNRQNGNRLDALTSFLEEVNPGTVVHAPEGAFSGMAWLTRKEILSSQNAPFGQLAASRHSFRTFSADPVEEEDIERAVEISIRTPSSCNRQPWKVHYFSGKSKCAQMLKYQNGNRGFGHAIGTLLVVTCDLRCFENYTERNQPYIDGGMFVMSLLYALQSQGLATCCLNMCTDTDTDKRLRKVKYFQEEEIFIAMIGVGHFPDSFKVAQSTRKPLRNILLHHD